MPNRCSDSVPHWFSRGLALVICALSLAGCAKSVVATAPSTGAQIRVALAPPVAHHTTLHARHHPVFRPHRATAKSFDGIASYYSGGTQVATGARYEPEALTAAHRSLPFGTRLRVSDPKTGRSVVVIINDRGPYVPGRVIDLSAGAARALGIEERGVRRVHVDLL